MKKISLWASMLALLVCGLCVTSCSKDDNNKEKSGDGGKQTTYNLNDDVDTYYVLCERVGNSLILEFQFKNKTAQTITGAKLKLGVSNYGGSGVITDNLGNDYITGGGTSRKVYLASAITKDQVFIEPFSNFDDEWQTINIPAGATANYLVKIINFDPSGRANKISFDLDFSATSGLPAQNYALETSTIPVEDNRVLSNGIQTPDLNLDVQLVGTEVDEDNNLIIDYTITNYTGKELKNFMVGVLENIGASDNVNNSYYWRDNVYTSLNNSDYAQMGGYNPTYYNGSGYFGKWCKTNFPAGATIPAKVLIKGIDSRATNVTFDLGISSENYEPMDNKMHFLTIPIQR